MRLERSRDAESDLDDLLNFSIERHGETVAHAYFFGFEDAFALLRRHPEAGQAMDALRPGLRKLTHRRHRIFYEIVDDHILVLRILHHAMSLDERF